MLYCKQILHTHRFIRLGAWRWWRASDLRFLFVALSDVLLLRAAIFAPRPPLCYVEGRTSPRDELWLLVRSSFCTGMGIAAENCHISFSALPARQERERGDGLKVVVTLTNAV